MPPIEPNRAGSPEPEGPSENGRGGESSRSVLSLMALGLRRRRLLVGLPLGVMAAALTLSFLMPAQYMATSRLFPESDSDMPEDLAGVAAQFGLSMGGAVDTESLDFYGHVVRSHELLSAVALHEYEFTVGEGRDTLRGDLISLYEIRGDTPKERLNAAVERLYRRDMNARLDRAANVMVLDTRAPWPELAESINRRILTLVNEFNLERRQSRASLERSFLETRVAEAEGELRAAEAELQRFIQTNRRYADAPETAFEYGRMQRRVDFLQQVHSSLVQALEQARVDAIRNVPVVTVLDRPEGTSMQTAPRPLINAVLGLILGAALAASILLLGELLRSARRSHPRDFLELEAATRDTLDGLRPFRRRREGAGRVDSESEPVAAGVREEDG